MTDSTLIEKKIAIILPYFGKFDSLFSFWLKSCEINKSIDWLIFTDDKRDFNYPSNVKVVYTTFKKIKDKIQALYDFKISLDTPYRLCNFKPAYGHIFKEYLDGYTAWGYCDNDLIFGNLSTTVPNLTENIFTTFVSKKQIGTFGHLSILPFEEETIHAYKYHDAYKIAFSTPEPLFYDEDTFLKILDIKNYEKISLPVANFVPRLKNFCIDYEQGREWINGRHVFIWDKGFLWRYYINKTNNIIKEEYSYIHFLKRPMTIAKDLDFSKPIAIVPNRIFNINHESINKKFIISHNQPGIFWKYWFNSLKPKNFFKRIYYRVYQNKINNSLIAQMNNKIHND